MLLWGSSRRGWWVRLCEPHALARGVCQEEGCLTSGLPSACRLVASLP